MVAAALLITDPRRAGLPSGIDDSKCLDPEEREALYASLSRCAVYGIGIASVDEIDELNILEASLLAMRRAVLALPAQPRFALVDGNQPPALDCPVRTVPGGDAACVSIAAASILAKVTRDRIMDGLAAVHPVYGWDRNRGYATPAHRQAIRQMGVTCHHRRTFGTVRSVLAADSAA